MKKKKIKINNKKVESITFSDGTTIKVKDLPYSISVALQGFANGASSVASTLVHGEGSVVVQNSSGVVSNSTIVSSGDFRLGK